MRSPESISLRIILGFRSAHHFGKIQVKTLEVKINVMAMFPKISLVSDDYGSYCWLSKNRYGARPGCNNLGYFMKRILYWLGGSTTHLSDDGIKGKGKKY